MKFSHAAVNLVTVLSLICVSTSVAKPHGSNYHHPIGKYKPNQMRGWTPRSRNDIFRPELRVKADIENKMRSVANKERLLAKIGQF